MLLRVRVGKFNMQIFKWQSVEIFTFQIRRGKRPMPVGILSLDLGVQLKSLPHQLN